MTESFDADLAALQNALAGEYSIERELGRGGMGVVYLAREVRLDRLVALKVLPPALGAARPELRERFLREARTSAKLSHPNIVPIFRADEIGGFVFFAMGYVEGETLSQRVRHSGPLTPRDLIPIVREVAWALAYAHARGIVHRDVKPDNILLEHGTNRALVTDFGIAHVAQASALTQDGMVMGTAHYMSPEQAAGEPVDGRSDLYSLGVVAYFALTGKMPFDAPTMNALLAMHLTQPPPPIAMVRAGMPRGLTTTIERCLAKDPVARFQTGEALAEALAAPTQMVHDIPTPVRVWAQKGQTVRVLAIIWYLFTILDMVDGSIGLGHLVALTIPIAVWLGVAITHTRQVLESGYSLEDLRLGLRSHIERREEETAFEVGQRAPLMARVIRDLGYIGLVNVAASAAVLYVFPSRDPEMALEYLVWFGISCVSTVTSGLIGLFYPGRRVGAKSRLDQLRIRFWNSRFGEWIADMAGKGLHIRTAADSTHRPTELAIGSAADILFQALPKLAKQELRDLPDVMRQLEQDAQAMRKRIDQLTLSVADVNSGTGSATLSETGAVALQKTELVRDLERAREEATGRLQASVAALERIRLGLVRLHAGAGTAADVTATLQSAKRVADDLEYRRLGDAEASAMIPGGERTPAGA